MRLGQTLDYYFTEGELKCYKIISNQGFSNEECHEYAHTAGSDTIFVQIYMDPPPGVPGVSKNLLTSLSHEATQKKF